MLRPLPALAAAALLLPAEPGRAQDALTLDQALTAARERAPALQAARLQIDEARGQLLGARALLGDNPTLSGGLGRRFVDGRPGAHPPEAQLQLAQPIEIAGQRAARIDAASAELAAAGAASEMVQRQTEAEVAHIFYRGLHATERMRLAEAARDAAERSAAALKRRHQLGDVPPFEVNLARTALARATADLHAARALQLGAQADLRSVLGLTSGSGPRFEGQLRDQRRYQLPRLLARAGDRPETRALLAQAREARADEALGRAERWPGLALGGSYERDDGEHVVLGTLSLTLPLFQRGQGRRATASARARRLTLQAEGQQRSAQAAVRAAFDAHQERLAAARALEEILPLVEDNEALASRSYQAGQMSLADWLVVRHEAIDTRTEYLARLLEAAEAGVALAVLAGVSP
jgi:cobalt-zinc-cadmium efflux system outer membrane protein